MAFAPPQDNQMGGQATAAAIARNSPQVARIISPPVADTTWPQTGQVLAGASRRRRHSLPQPVVPDVPQENTCPVKQNLPQHMDLDSSTHKSSPIVVNPTVHNPLKNTSGSSRQHTVASITQSTVNSSLTQSRTLNGITMDLDFEPPTSQPMNFGGGFEEGIPFTRPPQLTLHSPTNDNKSKGSHQSLGKSHLSSLASRKAARQHHFHERRGAQLHRIQLGGKRHLTDLDPDDEDDDNDGYYTSSGPACKQFINEERMAARMNNLNISGGNSSAGSSFSLSWQAAPAHNSQRFEWQNSRRLPTFAELESRLSDSDPSEDEAEFRLEYAPELRKALRKKDGPLPEALAQQISPNCMQLVLWQPPAPILEEKIKVMPGDSGSSSTDCIGNSSGNSPAATGEASMECATESINLTPPAGSSGSSEQRNVSPGTDWGANVQLFDSVDDDDMDL